MCRSLEKDGVYRRCPNGSDGSRGCEYIDQRVKATTDEQDIPTQKFAQVHKETLEELRKEHPEEVLQQKVEPEDYDKFKKAVNKMITESDMSDHDKMIARKQWNRAEKEVHQGQVTVVTLTTWQKVLIGTALFMLNTSSHRKSNHHSFQQKWTGIQKVLNMSVDIRDYYKDPSSNVITEQEREEDRRQQRLLDKETEEQARIQSENEAVTELLPQVEGPAGKPKKSSVKAEPVPVKKDRVPVKAEPVPVKKDKVPVKAEPVPVKKPRVPAAAVKTPVKKEKPAVKKAPVNTRKPAPASVKREAPSVKKTAPSIKKEAPSVKKTGKK